MPQDTPQSEFWQNIKAIFFGTGFVILVLGLDWLLFFGFLYFGIIGFLSVPKYPILEPYAGALLLYLMPVLSGLTGGVAIACFTPRKIILNSAVSVVLMFGLVLAINLYHGVNIPDLIADFWLFYAGLFVLMLIGGFGRKWYLWYFKIDEKLDAELKDEYLTQ